MRGYFPKMALEGDVRQKGRYWALRESEDIKDGSILLFRQSTLSHRISHDLSRFENRHQKAFRKYQENKDSSRRLIKLQASNNFEYCNAGGIHERVKIASHLAIAAEQEQKPADGCKVWKVDFDSAQKLRKSNSRSSNAAARIRN